MTQDRMLEDPPKVRIQGRRYADREFRDGLTLDRYRYLSRS